ncbi:MAG TPA: S24 family peptidase [Chloroflexota bacterium]|nr:S24 family peptidase [Chloroflexota bacterium]
MCHRQRPEYDLLVQLVLVLAVPKDTLSAAAGYRVEPLLAPPEPTAAELMIRLAARLEKKEGARPLTAPVVETAALSTGAGAYAEAISFLPKPGQNSHPFVAVPIVGDCIEPEINPGHLAIIDKTAEPRPGEIVAADPDGV